MELKEVNTKKQIVDFVHFPMKLYKNDKLYVPPILKEEIKQVKFILEKRSENFDAAFWILKDKYNIIGRVATFIQHDVDPNTAILGWFECVDDDTAFKMLISKTEECAKSRGAKKLHGPMGLTSFEKSGILIEGYAELPTVFSCYSKPYYKRLFEEAGYEKEYDWVEYSIKVPTEIPPKILKSSTLIKKRYGLQLVDNKTLKDVLPYKELIRNLLNEAYSGLDGFKHLSRPYFNEIFTKFSKLSLVEYTALIKNKEGELVGFGLALPSYARAMIKAKGKLFPFGFLHIMKAKKNTDTADLLLIAIKQEYRQKGVPALMFEKIIPHFIRNNILYVETTKELETNRNIQNLWHGFDYRLHKKSRCFKKLLY